MGTNWDDLHPVTKRSIEAQTAPCCHCNQKWWLCAYHEGVDYGAEVVQQRVDLAAALLQQVHAFLSSEMEKADTDDKATALRLLIEKGMQELN